MIIRKHFTREELPPIREIPGRPRYFVTDQGELYHLLRNGLFSLRKWAKASPNRKRDGGKVNYLSLSADDFPFMTAHKAVMLAWGTPKPEDKDEIDHRNGDPKDNRIINLEWVTTEENNRRRWILYGLRKAGINPTKLPLPVLNKYLDPRMQTDPLELAARDIDKYR